jgi:multidrug resistance efflux pump
MPRSILTKKSLLKSIFVNTSLLGCITIGGFLYWFFCIYPFEVSEDVYVDGHSVLLSAKQRAQIVDKYYDEGESVKRGDLLFKLDSSLFDIKLSLEKEKLKHAEDHFLQSKKDKENSFSKYLEARNEFESLKIEKKDFNKVIFEYEKDQASCNAHAVRVDVIKAKISILKKKIKKTKIICPCDGFLVRSKFSPGDMIDPNIPLCVLYEKEKFWINAKFSKKQAKFIKQNTPVRISLDAYPGYSLIGVISEIEKEKVNEEQSGKIFVRISINQLPKAKDFYLRPGMSGRVNIKAR